jgi:hypothetical protein
MVRISEGLEYTISKLRSRDILPLGHFSTLKKIKLIFCYL